MEPAQPSKRKGRSKSVSSKVANDSTETAPNLNGNKDGGKEEEPQVADKQAAETQQAQPKPTNSRKRKASELKSDSTGGDEINEKETKEVIESEKKEAPKDNAPANDSLVDGKDINLPPKQTLGKGKRARIPNKRYSDIMITTSPKISDTKRRFENGETQDGDSTEKENTLDGSLDAGYNSPTVSSLKISRIQSGSPSTPSSAKKQKTAVDLTNPNYLKPFQYGWKRELVYRATSDSSLKRNGDIYYYTPSGKKVRSMREVSENLKNKELTLDDFTFYKEPLGLEDPEKEIIRDAKLKSGPRESTPKIVKVPKVVSPKPTPPPPVQESPKPKATPKVGGSFKVKLPNKGQTPKSKTDKKPKDDGGDMEVGTYPPNWTSPTKKASKWGNNLSAQDKQQPCSIRCEYVSKPIPTLQCRFCLCLYHNECVGLSPLVEIEAYVCKNCQLRHHPSASSNQTLVPPPPLTPIKTLKSASAGSSILPKLQRIPKQGEQMHPPLLPKPPPKQKPDVNVDLPKLTPRPGILNTITKYVKHNESGASQTESKSLVGSVTTWFPPSSTIQVGISQSKNNEADLQSVPRPQFVEYLGRKKFLIVPKHNILSVSPAVASTANKAEDLVTTPDSLNVGNDSGVRENPTEAAKIPDSPRISTEISEVCDIKVEPESPKTLTPPPLDPPSQPMDVDPVNNSNQNIPEPELRTQQDDGQEVTSEAKQNENQEPVAYEQESAKTTPAKTKATPKSKTNMVMEEKNMDAKFMDNYLQNLAYGYGTLLYVFQYLKVQDLLRAGCVCTMWRDVANHPVLWRTVRMKNSQIHSFEGLADTLQKHGTINLDLRKMLLPSGGDEIWPSFSNAIKKVDSLRKIELCRCPAVVVEQLATSNPKLEVINAITIKCETMSLEPFANVTSLQELRLKSTAGLTLTSTLSALKELKHLKHLSLTSIKDLNQLNIDVIADLQNLESLDLGECSDFPNTFGSGILIKLDKLEKLRLEKGQGTCYTFEILEAVKNMPRLEQLELVNFDIKTGFDKALGACTNIKKLLIIPTYISQSATTNHMVLGGVLRLQSTLSHFVWGVTLELLRVTELFVDQCEDNEKKERKERKPVGNGDSIPVLKPVPLLGEISDQVPQTTEPPQVEILPLPNLQKLLLQNLPTTRVKILKIPFHATWRQTITDTVN